MTPEKKYHFAEDRHAGAIRGNMYDLQEASELVSGTAAVFL